MCLPLRVRRRGAGLTDTLTVTLTDTPIDTLTDTLTDALTDALTDTLTDTLQVSSRVSAHRYTQTQMCLCRRIGSYAHAHVVCATRVKRI